VKQSNSSCRCKKREQNLTGSPPGFQYELPEETVLPRQLVEGLGQFLIVPAPKSKISRSIPQTSDSDQNPIKK
jgi:hypothetical protein